MSSSADSMPKQDAAFVLHKVDDARVEVYSSDVAAKSSSKKNELGPDDIVVAPRHTGICGSDVHYWTHGRIGHYVVEAPMILGHESSGIVTQVGSKVKHLSVGDRVALEPGAPCRVCPLCKEGNYQRCPDVVFAATPPVHGTLQSFYTTPADLAYKLPDSISLQEGALMEPLSVAVHAVVKIGQIQPGANVAVFGAGPVGLLVMAVAKGLGARRVIAVDLQDERLAFAKSYAATDVFKSLAPDANETRLEFSQRQADEIKRRFALTEIGTESIDLVVDATGAEVCVQTATYLARSGGTVVQVGLGAPALNLPVVAMMGKELVYKTSFRYGPGVFNLSVDLVARGAVDVKPLITHNFEFADALAAFETTKNGKGPDGKMAIKTIIGGP